jgi:DNA-binding NarL/FixJ family response regulator
MEYDDSGRDVGVLPEARGRSPNMPGPEAPDPSPGVKAMEVASSREPPAAIKQPDRCIALVEPRAFMRECVQRGIQATLSLPVVSFATLTELEAQFDSSVALVLLSLAEGGEADCAKALSSLSALGASVPVVVLGAVDDVDQAIAAINLGAKGYFPPTMEFGVAVEAVRFILAGGAYIPAHYLGLPPRAPVEQAPPPPNVLTKREARVVQAIREGKSNKVIAYQLGMCEGTVKVHLRNIMSKMKAKNRTEVAIRAQEL